MVEMDKSRHDVPPLHFTRQTLGDYAARCPEQHLAYLRCLRDNRSIFTFNAFCGDEYGVFQACLDSVMPRPEPPAASGFWQQLRHALDSSEALEALRSFVEPLWPGGGGGERGSSGGSGSSSTTAG
jgi:hypothetical protein